MNDKNDKDFFVRGQRTRFSRRERVALHRLPSAQTSDPHIVHTRPHHKFSHACARLFLLFVLGFAIILAAVFYVIESGSLDRFLASKANEQIRAAMPDGYHASIEAAALRVGGGLSLRLNVSGVNLFGPSEKEIASIGVLSFAIDPVSLARGQISVNAVLADDIDVDASALPSTGTFRLTDHRVDSLPILVEQIFTQTDFARGILSAAETQTIQLSDIQFPVGSASPGRTVSVDIREVNLNLLPDGVLRVDGAVSLDGTATGFTLEAIADRGRTKNLQAEISNVKLTPFLLQENNEGEAMMGVEGTADMAIALARAAPGGLPEVVAEFDVAKGRFVADSIARAFSDARLNLTYDTDKQSLELTDSSIDFDGSRFPFTAGIMDLDRFRPGAEEAGYALDVLVRGGRFKSREPGLPPLIFDAKFTGEYQTDNPRLLLDNIAVSSPQGIMAASFKAVFGNATSPELSFGARVERMDTEAVKQLWPFWIARKPREWVSRNLHGGVVTNGDIAVYLPAGRIEGQGVPVNLDETELNIAFDIDDTRITLNDKFPDVNRSDARVEIMGESVDVEIEEGTLSIAKGRTITLREGTFAIADSFAKPLTGEVDVMLAGKVRDLVELAAAPPINALKGLDFTPDDFAGMAEVNVKARFPLDEPGPLPPTWSVAADISEGKLAKPVSGYTVADLSGLLEIVPDRLAFEGTGTANGVPLDIEWAEPLGANSKSESVLWLAADLDDSEREKLAPGLGSYVNGPISMSVENEPEGSRVTLDLRRTVLSLPWMGWKKPSGTPATLSFRLDDENKDGLTILEDLQLSGSGLSAHGSVTLDKDGLLSTTLTHVALTKGDDVNIAIQREQQGLDVVVTGRSFMASPLLDHLSASDDESGEKGGNDNARVHFDIARVTGEGGRQLSSAAGDLLVRSGDVVSGSLSATTATGQPLTLKLGIDGGKKTVSLATSGTGALLRFLGVYQKMTGGTLDLNLVETASGWRGLLNLTEFRLINDQQLKRLLSSPTGSNGKSLNATYRNQINESEQRFQRGQAVIDISDGVLQVSDAFVRGDQVGATFKGVVRDAAGNIDMTGTFMPAYGLNRIFAEIPIFGPLLGNGNDKGLFGITFKLTGKTADPDLVVNPLSAIAPGVFRKIFEFQ
ncbi:DUF3971 domain-containing protein [Martelella radicis]|uniref:YhdP central domain-containing protein n=1 Tax=Martelella radicis TaxID=1397476 RepID=A0A7W6KI18_9HYPH|nr:DUF3971 domain-containing protein [Martelella radicis]MBB4121679.1 hypothetical protein [Martelella radicis]